VYLGYSFGYDRLSPGSLAVAVVRQPQRLDIEEMHPKASLENPAAGWASAITALR
jgi:hypothetical protein